MRLWLIALLVVAVTPITGIWAPLATGDPLPFPRAYTATFDGERRATTQPDSKSWTGPPCFGSSSGLVAGYVATWQGTARFERSPSSVTGRLAVYDLVSGSVTVTVRDSRFSFFTETCTDGQTSTTATADCRRVPARVTGQVPQRPASDALRLDAIGPSRAMFSVSALSQDETRSAAWVCTGTDPSSTAEPFGLGGFGLAMVKELRDVHMDRIPLTFSGHAGYPEEQNCAGSNCPRTMERVTWTLGADACPTNAGSRVAAAATAKDEGVCKSEELVKRYRELAQKYTDEGNWAAEQVAKADAEVCLVPLVWTPESRKQYQACKQVVARTKAMFSKMAAEAFAKAARYWKLAKDPPDERFKRQVSTPAVRRARPPRGLPKRAAQRLRRAYTDAAEQVGHLRATVTAFERAQGASLRGERAWTRRQLTDAADHAEQAARLAVSAQRDHAFALRGVIAAGPRRPPPTETLAAAIREQVKRDGLPDVQAALREIGVPAQQMDAVIAYVSETTAEQATPLGAVGVAQPRPHARP